MTSHPFTVWLPPAQWRKLERLARKADRSKAYVLRQLLEQAREGDFRATTSARSEVP